MTEAKVSRRGVIGGGAELAAVAAAGHALGADGAQAAQKTFVLVHGTLVGGWYWRRVSDLLEKKGQKVFSPTLTGLGERSHLLNNNINLETHITDIVNVIKWENLKDVCLVAHSYGGWRGLRRSRADRRSCLLDRLARCFQTRKRPKTDRFHQQRLPQGVPECDGKG